MLVNNQASNFANHQEIASEYSCITETFIPIFSVTSTFNRVTIQQQLVHLSDSSCEGQKQHRNAQPNTITLATFGHLFHIG